MSTNAELIEALRQLMPYALSRMEDMHAEGGDECPYWKTATERYGHAERLLQDHDRNQEHTA